MREPEPVDPRLIRLVQERDALKEQLTAEKRRTNIWKARAALEKRRVADAQRKALHAGS